jgi:hypothetical protein
MRALTPAQRHRQRKLAEQASAGSAHGDETTGSAYELMQAQLYEHRKALKGIQSIERKIEAKRGYLPLYWPWIDGVLAADSGAQDMVLTSVFVWAIDCGEYPRALQMATYILAHELVLPDQYQRDPATTLIDEMSEAALKGRMAAEPAVELLLRVHELTEARDVPDQARAKLHKAIGYALVGRSAASEVDYKAVPLSAAQAALPHLHRAIELFDGIGVKKDIERLERRVKDALEPAP